MILFISIWASIFRLFSIYLFTPLSRVFCDKVHNCMITSGESTTLTFFKRWIPFSYIQNLSHHALLSRLVITEILKFVCVDRVISVVFSYKIALSICLTKPMIIKTYAVVDMISTGLWVLLIRWCISLLTITFTKCLHLHSTYLTYRAQYIISRYNYYSIIQSQASLELNAAILHSRYTF